MLRLLTMVLLAANLLYFGWTMGWLDAVIGIRATGDREPARLARQIRPELVLIEAPDAPGVAAVAAVSTDSPPASASASAAPTAAASAASAPQASASTPATVAAAKAVPPIGASAARSDEAAACLEAGPFEASDLAAAETQLKSAWPAGQWTRRRVEATSQWMIYMGPYPDDEWLERKKGELARIRGGLPYEVLNEPPQLARGISLGRFASQENAERRLGELRLRGIRTARVVSQNIKTEATFLRVVGADANTAARLAGITWPSGKTGTTPCPAPPR